MCAKLQIETPMLTDPIQITLSTPPDRFLHLTSTAWTAIASIVAAITTLVLLIFNWRYLRLVHEQSDTAKKQIELTRDSLALATESLDALKKQRADEEERERHTAIAIIGEALNDLVLWNGRSRMEKRTTDSRINLLPENWGLAIAYLSRRAMPLAHKAHQAGRDLRNIEVDLNRFVQSDPGSRGNTPALVQLYDDMNGRMQTAFLAVDSLLNEVHNL